MKPTFDGSFKEAGAPLDQYVLENDNGILVYLSLKPIDIVAH
jgi:hypothetical protein